MDKAAKRAALITRLKKVEGQVRGIQRLIEAEESCEKVAIQLTAARRALDKAFFEMMACAVAEEVGRHQQPSAELEAGIAEVSRILSKYG